MYLMRTKKQYERQDSKDLQEKRDRLSEKLDDADKSTDSVEKSPAKTTNKKCEFFLDELPDGSCIRPRTISQDTQDEETAVRIAEYLGSFSVQGSDQNARAEYVAEKLVEFQSASKSKRVLLVISLSGVKVCSGDGQSVYMAHALKRISYATCDPPHHQFSFMAREPKGHINLQFCHVFSTSTQEEAEELNTIMDNAFKMAYAQQRTKQPTFNELIEKQLTDQQAKFEEYREQAQQAFKQKLDEIATPTPFSEKAKQHLEMRRQSSSDDVPEKEKEKETFVGRNKIWNFTLQRSPVKAKHMVGKVRHRSPVTESTRTSSPSRCKSPSTSTSSSSPSRPQSDFLQHYRIEPSSGSPNKRNSTPVSTTNQNNSSFLFFRSSFESSSSGKTKSSPVTALKEAIDKSFITNGSADPVELLSVHGAKDYSVLDPEGYLQPRHNNNNIKNSDERHWYSQKMVNRPLPALPTGNIENQNHKNWTSMDDNVVQRRSRSKGDSVSGSPRRQQARPQSEVFLDKRFSVSGTRFDDVGCYMYGSKSDIQLRQQLRQGFNQQSPHHVAHPRPRSRCDDYSGNTGKAPKLRMQNGNTQNPSQSDVFATNYENPDDVGRNNPGLESLMGLDRSHIEDETLRHSSWYQAGIPRDIALEILQQEEIGSFIVRDSTTHPGCYALSVRVPKFENPTGISHYLIMRTQTGVKLKGLDKEWPDLIALVTHHTVMSEMLPCTLRLPHKTNNLTFKDSDKDDKEDDPDYQRLSDFSSMMENMKV